VCFDLYVKREKKKDQRVPRQKLSMIAVPLHARVRAGRAQRHASVMASTGRFFAKEGTSSESTVGTLRSPQKRP
jgi:hypothetical protein